MQTFCCSRASFFKVLTVRNIVVITVLKLIPRSSEDLGVVPWWFGWFHLLH